jgi:hypothetical protein
MGLGSAVAILAVPVIAGTHLSTNHPSAAQPPATHQPPPQPPAPTQPPAQPPAEPPAQPPALPPAQPPTTAPETAAQAAASQTPSDGGALVLLNRITEIIDQSLGHSPAMKTEPKGTPGAKGTSGVAKGGAASSAGKVSVDRAALDEIRAEVEQLKIMLKPKAAK